MVRGASRSFLSNLALFITVTLFTSSSALSVDWTTDKHPVHTLGNVIAIVSGGSSDPSSVNVALVTFNKDTGEEHSIPMSNNVPSTGRYTHQVPNQYVGDPGSKAMKDYFTRDLRYKTRVMNPSNGQTLGESDDFVVYWNPDDGTPTPTQFSTTSSGGGGGGGSTSGTGGSGNTGGGDSGDTAGSSPKNNNGDSPTATKNGESNPDGSPASQGPSGTSPSGSTVTSAAGNQVLSTTATAFGENETNIVLSTGAFGVVTVGSTSVITSGLPGTTAVVSGASKNNHLGAILGSVIGVLALLLFLIGLVFWCRRRRARKAAKSLERFSKYPEGGFITPAFWADQQQDGERTASSNSFISMRALGGMSSNRRLSGDTLAGDGEMRDKFEDADLDSAPSPLSSSALSPTPQSPLPLLSTQPSMLPSVISPAATSNSPEPTFSDNSTFVLDHEHDVPPPEYSRRISETRSMETVLQNLA
ncbi:hypothetical protein DL96DRAFT_1823613 [Flagelloscypha sp. PMI_526]|nr:hypothetical protein DL96DRAFT_1823613 [Flagelloscypha sp. PMI_526]